MAALLRGRLRLTPACLMVTGGPALPRALVALPRCESPSARLGRLSSCRLLHYEQRGGLYREHFISLKLEHLLVSFVFGCGEVARVVHGILTPHPSHLNLS